MKRFALLVTLFLATAACAQSSAPPQTLNAANQCARIGAVGQATVGIQVIGTFSATLQPEVSIQGQAPQNAQVTPSTSSTPQSTITAAGAYTATVAGYNTFLVCVSDYTSGAAVVYLNALNGGAGNALTGGAAGLPLNSLQGNNGGVSAGIPGTAADFANGMVTIAPPSGFGSPAALSIQSNPAGADILDLYLTGQKVLGHISLRIYGTGDDAVQTAIQEQDTFGDVMLLDPANFSLFSNTPPEVFNCSLTNTGSSPL